MEVSDPKYQSHSVFTELNVLIDFYDALADSVFAWPTPGVRGKLGNIDTHVFLSISGTLASIQLVLKQGRINDAYALLRKYHDSAVINIYSNLFLTENLSIEDLVVKQIDDWVNGRSSLPEYRVMSQRIRESSKVELLNSLFFTDDRYKRIRERCNNHTHYNFYQFVLLNVSKMQSSRREHELAQLAMDVRDLFIFHVAYLFFIQPKYMMASDYIDYLECGLEPEEDSEYWVAQFVQEIVNDVVAMHRPDVVAALKANTLMHLASPFKVV